MTPTIGVIFFTLSIAAAVCGGQAPISNTPKADGQVAFSVTLIKSSKKELQYTLELKNNGSTAIYCATNPQSIDGEYGPYISLGSKDSSVMDAQIRVFDEYTTSAVEAISNRIRVELKRLGPGETITQTVSLKWALLRTVPPIFIRGLKVDRKDVKTIRFTVGYFDEEEGIKDFLTRKPFGWFIKGSERLDIGAYRGKRFFEIQKLVSFEVSVPEIKE